MNMNRLLLAVFLSQFAVCAGPIRLNPENPHYYEFRGKPAILVTSAEHYGAVLNKDFDYIAYFDVLHNHGLNYTRIYPGALFEPIGKFIPGNTLAPRPASLLVPWARSNRPGYALGGNKFDLDRWDPEYFRRLKDFILQAGKRGIVVEICFFNAQYSDTWPISPLYADNNIQGGDYYDYRDAQTLKHPDLVRRESDYVREITRQVNAFDNVILEICDEPFLTGTPIELAGPWIAHMIGVIETTERGLPEKHLIAQQMEGPIGGDCDFTTDPRVSVIVSQYVWESMAEQMGGMKALDYEYDKGKAVELNETDYYPVWYQGDKVADSRVEAWEFMVGGGAGFNQLNGIYTVRDPAGNTPDNARILRSLQALKAFIESFDFLKMRPDRTFVIHGVPRGTFARGMSEPGKQYAWYLHHSTGGMGSEYVVTPGDYRDELELRLPAGAYQADWVDPATGSMLGTHRIAHKGGSVHLTTPPYTVDIALRIRRSAGR